jgi:D-serine deaminase-like pyridoxal phosphate-dependent protein
VSESGQDDGMRDTPFLAVDVDLLERNLKAMANHAATAGLELRPHAKTHKSVFLAQLQIERGAVGITVATVSEAEIFASAGLDDIFIAYPIWAEGPRAERLRTLATRTRLRVGADSIEGVRQLAQAMGSQVHRLAVAIEVDSGHHRSGRSPESAAEVAAAALEVGLTVDGVFTFPGHSYGPGAGDSAARDEAEALTIARGALTAAGIPCPVVSGGSTPSADAARSDVLTELRPGVYVFGDAQQWELGTCAPESIALTVRATVVSRRDDTVIVDAGSKALGADRASWASGYGRVMEYPNARILALSEHHATVRFPSDETPPAAGTRLRIVPNHVCSAVNLADRYTVEREGAEIDEWRIDARGANT